MTIAIPRRFSAVTGLPKYMIVAMMSNERFTVLATLYQSTRARAVASAPSAQRLATQQRQAASRQVDGWRGSGSGSPS
jgi:hypothetical protein